MKKFIIAAAIATTMGVSYAQTVVYGQVNQYLSNTKTGTANSVSGLTSDISRIGFSSTEDLGRGLKARAVVETSIMANDPTAATTQLGDRQSTVGLAHNLGSIDIGRNLHTHFLTVANADPFGVQYGTIAGDVHGLRGLRFSNGTFVSINPMAGVGVSYNHSINATGKDAYNWGATASFGPVNIAGSSYRDDANSASSDVIGANAKLGNTTVYASYSKNKDGTVERNGQLYAVAQQFGAVTLKAGYGKDDANLKASNIGAAYAFSKRTSVEVAYRNVDSGVAADVKQLGVGMRHAF